MLIGGVAGLVEQGVHLTGVPVTAPQAPPRHAATCRTPTHLPARLRAGLRLQLLAKSIPRSPKKLRVTAPWLSGP